jgi:hypothetical protein
MCISGVAGNPERKEKEKKKYDQAQSFRRNKRRPDRRVGTSARASPQLSGKRFRYQIAPAVRTPITPQTLKTATDEIRNGKYSLFRHRCQPSAMPTLTVI